jgi:hypothetical protein
MAVYLDTKVAIVWFVVLVLFCYGLINYQFSLPQCKDIVEVEAPCPIQQTKEALVITTPCPLVVQAPSVNTMLCTQNTRINPFTNEEMNIAKQMRRDWTRSLPFQIEEMLTRNAVPGSSEREYPLSHARFDVLGPMTPTCHELESFGAGDGEKRACSLTKLIHSGQDDCTIISLGSNNEWDFEVAIYNAFPACQIETFDCTLPSHIRPPAHIASRTRLHHVCVGPTDRLDENGREYKSWKSILTLMNVKTAPLYLKMDIEGHEYQVLRSIIDDGTMLPMQIAFELHYQSLTENLPWALNQKRKSTAELLTFMEYLHYEGGYFFIDQRNNVGCFYCTELLITQLPCQTT